MKKSWKPDITLDLGDVWDTAAFRSGAKGTKDESEPIPPDITAGLQWLEEYRPNYLTLGNHDQRIIDLMDHPNALVQQAAKKTWQEIETTLDKFRISWRPYHPELNWVQVGNFKFGHGLLYNENYLRDSAETFGNCVVAHAHRAGSAEGRTLQKSTAYGVGTLSKRLSMGYSLRRRSTLAWSGGFVWGEYNTKTNETQIWLHDNGQSDRWRLPV
jgi:hypothetical protein